MLVYAALRTPEIGTKRMTTARRLMFSFNPASWPISTEVVAVILAVSLAPMLLTAYYNTSSSLEALHDIGFRSQRQIAGNVAGRIGQLLNDTRRTVTNIASEPILSDALEQKKDDTYKNALGRLQRYVAVNPDVDLVIVMDQTGTAIGSSEPTTLGGNDKFREYFAQAMPVVDAALLSAPVPPGVT